MLEAIAARNDCGWLESWLDEIVAMCDVGQERPLPEDASEYERSQWMRQREEMAEALRKAPWKMQQVAKELRRVADRLDEAAGGEDDP
jgi:transcriptional regulator of acetoin/glycerol metabolism